MKLAMVFSLCLAIVNTIGSGYAGAPAPRPDTGGEHLPPHQLATLGDFTFESGETVSDFKVSYVTHGRLNAARDNAILVIHFFGGDHHSGDHLIGPGLALDTDKYFIIATDALGNSHMRHDLTTGPTNSGLKMDFPRYSFRDSVTVEYRLLKEYLGLDRIVAAIGFSIGAMKAYQFAVSYPDYMTAIIPIAGSPMADPMTRWVTRLYMDVIALDSGWQGGNYEINPETGVLTLYLIDTPLTFTPQWFRENAATDADFYGLRNLLRDYWMPQDARDVYYASRAWSSFDIGDTPGFDGDTEAALRSIRAKVLAFQATRDLTFDRQELDLARAVIPDMTYVEIDSVAGHAFCCGLDPEADRVINERTAAFLDALRE